MRLRNALILIAPLLGGCFPFAPLGTDVYAGYLSLTPTGDLGMEDSTSSQPLPDIKIDVANGYDVDDTGAPYIRVDIDGTKWDLTASAFYFEQDGDLILPTKFGDLPAGSTVHSNLTILNTKVGVTYAILDAAFVDVGVGVSLDYFDIDMDVRSSAPLVGFEEIDFRAPVPMLFARASAGVGIVAADLEVGWMNIHLNDAKGNFLDIDGRVSVSVAPLVELFGGYRYVLIDVLGDVDGQAFDTDLELTGWVLGGLISF